MKNIIKTSILSIMAMLLATQASFAQQAQKQVTFKDLKIAHLYKDKNNNYLLEFAYEGTNNIFLSDHYFYGNGKDFYQLSGNNFDDDTTFRFSYLVTEPTVSEKQGMFILGNEKERTTLICNEITRKFWEVDAEDMEDAIHEGKVALHSHPTWGGYQEWLSVANPEMALRVYQPSFDFTPGINDDYRVFSGDVNHRQLRDVPVKSVIITSDGSLLIQLKDKSTIRIPAKNKVGEVTWTTTDNTRIIYKKASELGAEVITYVHGGGYPFQTKTPCELLLGNDGERKLTPEEIQSKKQNQEIVEKK